MSYWRQSNDVASRGSLIAPHVGYGTAQVCNKNVHLHLLSWSGKNEYWIDMQFFTAIAFQAF